MIIKCPYCHLQGKTKNLAEILPNGDIKILRMIKSDGYETSIDFTIIRAVDFSLICGECLNGVVYKKPIEITPQVDVMMTWGTMMTYYGTN